ncbi:MATE family efflux transporter [Phreatobacter stygius]|uniref:Multidrug-efflux transporter n=1 Tax=Phreatobacter stygius TaxID=1940610 RepID=A0A4D7B0G1_9HYPH|nr:MATE family efflux transporter [Phreatobacter stygius]QCI67129.1 MATE family efflux transporter [Phreatobacter stygius]
MHEPSPQQPLTRAVLREARASLALGWPLVLTNIAQVALIATDLIFVGRLGKNELAATAMAASLYQAVMLFSMGIVSASMLLMARTLGRDPHAVDDIRRTVTQGLWSAGLISVPAWALLWHCDSIFVLLGQDPDLAARSTGFMHALQWGLLPYLGYIVLRSFLAAMQRPLWTMLVAAVAAAFNALAGWCLIYGHLGFPALGLTGAGLATSGAMVVLFLGLVVVVGLDRRFRGYRLFQGLWRPDLKRLAEIWRLGLPIGMAQAFETSIFYASAMMMGLLGATALAAHAIVAQIGGATFMAAIGLSQAASVRVGRAHGAADPAAARLAGWTAYGLTVAYMLIVAAVMLVTPKTLIGVFIDTEAPLNRDVVLLASTLLICAALFQLGDGIQVACLGMLRGLHDTSVPMLLTAIGYWGIGMPLGATLAFVWGFGGVGIWLGLASGLSAVAVLTTWRWARLSARLGT